MIPHTAPPFWPETRPGRLAHAIYRNSVELLERPAELRTVTAKCRIGLLGLADDAGVALNHGRVGAAGGPNAFRAALARYGVASPMDEGEQEPPTPHIFDAGNVVPGRDLHETHDRVTAAVSAILGLGLFPVGIGGGHDLTFPFVRAVAAHRALGAGVYFDAHLDVRETLGSGMPFRRIIETCGISRLTCIGADPDANSRSHFDWFEKHGGSVQMFPPDSWPAHPEQFVSVDLDVLDGAYAPGVSAINPCGMTPEGLGRYVFAAGRNRAVRCMDFMELNPAHDVDGRTARVAAWLFVRFVRGFGERGQG